MTIKKYPTDDDRIKIFKALSDPIRLQIIRILKDRDTELSCGEIGDLLEMSKSAASYHFKTLREAKLTITRKSGQNKFVRLNLETFNTFLPSFLDSLNKNR